MGRRHVMILDGGTGTTLEDVFKQNIDSSLWSGNLIKNDSEVLTHLHKAFISKGADIISAATYQCSFDAFAAANVGRAEAVKLMRKAVELARAACTSHANKVALTLGPYGACMQPAQEYTGHYPKSMDHNALVQWHLERLLVFADCREIWQSVDFIAFETIPRVDEAYAVCSAMQRIYESHPLIERIPFWISFVFPDSALPDGSPISAISGLFGSCSPWAIGINCTKLEALATILDRVQSLNLPEDTWLVLYPDGGSTYSPETRSWGTMANDPALWAAQLAGILEKALPLWPGIVVGGCCKTTPMHIHELRSLLSTNDVVHS